MPSIEDRDEILENLGRIRLPSIQYEQISNRKVYDTFFGGIEVNVKAAIKVKKVSDFGIEKDISERMFNASFTSSQARGCHVQQYGVLLSSKIPPAPATLSIYNRGIVPSYHTNRPSLSHVGKEIL